MRSPRRTNKRPEDQELDRIDDDDDDVMLDSLTDDPRDIYGSDPAYNSAVSKADYIRVRFVNHLKDFIDGTTLFPDTKGSLKIIVYGLFDKTEVLARSDNLQLDEIDAEIVIAQARIGFHPSDVDNPDLANIFNLIRKLYKRFISRSYKGWERELDNRMETSHTQTVVDTRFQQPQAAGGKQYPIWHPRRWI